MLAQAWKCDVADTPIDVVKYRLSQGTRAEHS